MGKPVLLDLFCGAGGAAKGYADAGFEVIGVDLNRQPRYPHEFHQADAIAYLDAMLTFGFSGIDAVHASPPCQRYSTVVKMYRAYLLDSFPDLVATTRATLTRLGLPFVIENVPGAPLINPVTLCGSQFGLVSAWPGIGKVGLRRHRNFEPHGFMLLDPGLHDHSYKSVPVYGHMNHCGKTRFIGKGYDGESFSQLRKQVMGVDWMTNDELNESIPPAYTEYIGYFLMQAIAHDKGTVIGRSAA